MKILAIKNITRKEVPIYYRRVYSGLALIELLNKTLEVALEFLVENKPTGQTEISVTLGEKIDYPLLPLKKELKNFIASLDQNGQLPI
jgi:hypothetical protein